MQLRHQCCAPCGAALMSEPVQEERFAQGMKIACPEGWRDKSMLILNADQPGPSGVTPNIVVTRETSLDDLLSTDPRASRCSASGSSSR